jgi:heptosyltransferase-1
VKVLIVKTSSMGDVIHTLPALTDAGNALPSISFDWVVEENFAEIPAWHPLVDEVIPVALRRWRKNIFSKKTRDEFNLFLKKIREKKYDVIIDAQGLLKSAFLTLFARGNKYGLDWNSAREPLASLFYQNKISVEKNQHAILRVRKLFASVLGYEVDASVVSVGNLSFETHAARPEEAAQRPSRRTQDERMPQNFLVFLHGTTWQSKHWPDEYWIQLAKIANEKNISVLLPWGNEAEKTRAEKIAANCNSAQVLPQLDLNGIAHILKNAKAVVAVDTGLAHLAAALDVPTVSLYGPTNPGFTGTLGKSQIHLTATFPCSPCFNRECTFKGNSAVKPACFETIKPEVVWEKFESFF